MVFSPINSYLHRLKFTNQTHPTNFKGDTLNETQRPQRHQKNQNETRMNCCPLFTRTSSKMTQVLLCALLIIAISQALIGKSHKSGWGGFDKRAGKVVSDLVDQSLRTFDLGEPLIPIAPVHLSQSKRNQFAHNFWGSIYLPPKPEIVRVRPTTTTAAPLSDNQKTAHRLRMSSYTVEQRTQTAYALLSLCCSAASCNQTPDKWNGICETLLLEAESCQPLWTIRCEVPEPLFLTRYREENQEEQEEPVIADED